MKILRLIFLFCLVHACLFSQGQNCVPIAEKPVQACVQTTELQKAKLRSLRKAPQGSLMHLFYNYFTGTDYAGYKSLFSPGDWYGLTPADFITWRDFIKKADLRILGSVELNALGLDLGMVKYTYVIEDELLYETFLAKKSGTQWRPVSMKQENDLVSVTGIIKNINLGYLSTLISATRQNDDKPGHAKEDVKASMHADNLLEVKDTDADFSIEEFKLHYNTDVEYRSNAKFKEDRSNDLKFVAYLTEMGLSQDQMDVVMKYIMIQDYLHAAQKADDYSEVSYTFSPFVEKIREVYGRDRLKKWDQANKKWD